MKKLKEDCRHAPNIKEPCADRLFVDSRSTAIRGCR